MAGTYTTADRDAVKDAIIDLATGSRVVSVAIAGRTLTYGTADLAALKTLLAEITEDLAVSTSGRATRSRVVITSKGL